VIDVDRVRAIDVHTHAEVSRDGHDPMPPELRAAAERYFRGKVDRPTADDVAAYYRERDMACVVFTVDYATRSGREPVPNEEVAEAAAANPDVMIAFASVDPHRKDAVERARRLIAEHHVTHYCAAPVVHNLLIDAPPELRATLDHELRAMIAAAPPPARTFDAGHVEILAR